MMVVKSTTIVPFARRRKKKTDYNKRLAMIKSGKNRLVVRMSDKLIRVQFVRYSKDGDVTTASAVSGQLRKLGWESSLKSIPAAYLTGLLCGSTIKEKKEGAIVDIGLHTPIHGSKIFAAVKGAIDAGVSVNVDSKVLPKEERIRGEHISSEVASNFEETKEKIMEKVSKDA
jgi:large subunit ribosomal protein L18